MRSIFPEQVVRQSDLYCHGEMISSDFSRENAYPKDDVSARMQRGVWQLLSVGGQTIERSGGAAQ